MVFVRVTSEGRNDHLFIPPKLSQGKDLAPYTHLKRCPMKGVRAWMRRMLAGRDASKRPSRQAEIQRPTRMFPSRKPPAPSESMTTERFRRQAL